MRAHKGRVASDLKVAAVLEAARDEEDVDKRLGLEIDPREGGDRAQPSGDREQRQAVWVVIGQKKGRGGHAEAIQLMQGDARLVSTCGREKEDVRRWLCKSSAGRKYSLRERVRVLSLEGTWAQCGLTWAWRLAEAA